VPDALTHYAASLLVASRAAKLRLAALIALVGLLPDLDVVLGIHRWITHSLVVAAALSAAALLAARRIGPQAFRYAALACALYALHLAFDALTAPTPLLWPLAGEAYMVSLRLDGALAAGGVALVPRVAVVREAVDFTPRPLEGPIVSAGGVIMAVTAGALLAAERICASRGRAGQRDARGPAGATA